MLRKSALGLMVLCPILAVGASRPPVCQQSTVPLKEQKPFEDLTGMLPVADYLDAVMDCSGVQVHASTRPQSISAANVIIPASIWLDADAKRYSELLAKRRYPLLVLPVQTEYLGFDHAERALISAEVASAFADQGSAPDPILVARALGEPRRRHTQLSGEILTAAIGATRRVDIYAGHDGAYKLTLTIRLQECGANGRCKLIKQRDWRGLAFSDELPPFRVVNKLQADIRRDLLGKGPLPAATAAAGTANYLGMTPAKLSLSAPTATTASLLASFAASFDELSRDRLHVIALRNWLNTRDTAESRFHAAYSALVLQRRPYALELIKQQKDPASDTLRELLNGNLIEARQKLAQVDSPLQRLMLNFIVQDVASAYGRETPFDDALAKQVFGEAQGQWRALIQRRAKDANISRRNDPRTVKLLLDELAPKKGLGLEEVSLGSVVAGRERPLGLVNFRHLRQSLPAPDSSATQWQAYWLLEGVAQADMFSDLARTIDVQAAPDAGIAIVREYEGQFAGHPAFELGRGKVMAMLGRRAENDQQHRFSQAYEQSEWSAAYWSQGANRISLNSVHRGTHTVMFADAYGRDFPPRYYWPENAFAPAPGMEGRACRSLKYSLVSVDGFTKCLQSVKGEEARKVRAEVRARFHGNPRAAGLGDEPLTPPPKPSADDTELLVARMRTEIQADPELWDNYGGIGGLLIQRRGEYAEAQRVYLSYPLFRTKKTNRVVELANNAYDAGSELFWQGQPDLARPLYRIAADLDTGGSGASLTSAARLAQLDGDYAAAAAISLESGRRYSSSYAYRDYLSLLYAMGHLGEADAAFSQIAEAFQGPHAWNAKMLGQRMEGISEDRFRVWITSKEVISARNRGRWFAGYHAVMWAGTDRKFDVNTVKLIEQLVSSDTRRIDPNGALVRAHPMNETALMSIRPSDFRPGGQAASRPKGLAPHEYVLFAQALSALRGGQYQSARDHFVKFASYYPIESGDTKVAMAYFALAAAKSGDEIGLEKFIEALPHWNQDFDVWLSRAFYAAARKDAIGAEHALKRAFYVRPHSEWRPVLPEYQYAEACEIIGRETGDPRFVGMMLDWARKNQRIQPTQAWSYAVEAQYSKNPEEAKQALAMALYLDSASPRLAGIDAKRKEAARAWLRTNNAFVTTKRARARPAT